MKFYTYFEQQKGSVFYRYIKNGKPFKKQIKRFPIELFIKSKNKDATSIFDESLGKIEFDSIKEARDFIEENGAATEIYGQTSFEHQFISDQYKEPIEFNFADLHVAIIDIECKFSSSFPTPDKAEQEITSICIKRMGDGYKFFCFGTGEYTPTEDTKYIKCESERDLLLKFIDHWKSDYCDIIMGYNNIGFDIPYLINRMKKIIGDRTVELSPFYQEQSEVFRAFKIQGSQQSYKILGINVIDFIELYKKFTMNNLESYRLDVVSEFELGERKLDYSEYGNLMDLYENDHQKYVDYNKRDVALVENLEKKLKYLSLAITIAFIAKVKFNEVFGQVKFWDTLIYNKLREQNIQIPPSTSSGEGGFSGAFVKEPVPKLYEWIVTFDVASLYPSIIISMNMSPETKIKKLEGFFDNSLINEKTDLEYLKAGNVCASANGTTFEKSRQGHIAKIIKNLFSERKATRSEMMVLKKSSGDKNIIENLNAKQQAIDKIKREIEEIEEKIRKL